MFTLMIIVIVSGLLYYLYWANQALETTHYAIKLPRTVNRLSGIKMVHLTDLHLPNSGASIESIVEAVKKEKPHIIVLTGDLIHASADHFPGVELAQFAKGLSQLAPVYAVAGNHDVGFGQMDKWTEVLESSGVRVLNNQSEWIPFGDEGFVLMGLAEKGKMKLHSEDFLEQITIEEDKAHLPKVLLAHHPEYFERYVSNKEKAPDLTIAGHAHGGQVILPFIGGLFAPGQGKLPTYDFGLYTSKEDPSKRMILSRGLGNSTFPLRINNRPEVVVITLL